MKKLFTLFALAFIIQVSFGQSSLPNGNFESWTYNETHDYCERARPSSFHCRRQYR